MYNESEEEDDVDEVDENIIDLDNNDNDLETQNQLEVSEFDDAKKDLDIDSYGGTNIVEEDEHDEDDINQNPIYYADINVVEPIPDRKSAPFVKVKIITGDDRVTSNRLTSYEKAAALGARAAALAKNNQPLIEGYIDPDPSKVAREEFEQGRCPIIIRRPVGLNEFELWSVSELIGYTMDQYNP